MYSGVLGLQRLQCDRELVVVEPGTGPDSGAGGTSSDQHVAAKLTPSLTRPRLTVIGSAEGRSASPVAQADGHSRRAPASGRVHKYVTTWAGQVSCSTALLRQLLRQRPETPCQKPTSTGREAAVQPSPNAFKNSCEVDTQPKRISIARSEASWLLVGASLPMGSLVQSLSTTH